MRSSAYQAALVVVLSFFCCPVADAQDQTVLSVRFHVAELEGEPVADQNWIDSQLEHANRIFEPSGYGFVQESVVSIAEGHERMETRQDRHALGAFIAPRVINVFLVESLRDVDEPDRMRMGVHWRPRGHGEGKHLVILSRTAGQTVLAHEFGHFFGNRRHPETAGNIMSYNRGEVYPFFNDSQLRTIRRFARRFIRSGELVRVRPTDQG